MPSLIVAAVFNGFTPKDQSKKLSFTASVSRSDNGVPITKLTEKNFRATDVPVAGSSGITDFSISVIERKWDPNDDEASGVYDITLTLANNSIFALIKGATYAVGLQVNELGEWPSKIGHWNGLVGQTFVAVVN